MGATAASRILRSTSLPLEQFAVSPSQSLRGRSPQQQGWRHSIVVQNGRLRKFGYEAKCFSRS